jgi:hypothetical protein
MTALVGSAALTLTCLIALVRVTIFAVSIQRIELRLIVLVADFVVGTAALVGCIYLATHLAVRIVGVGQAEFPPLPDADAYSPNADESESLKI